MKTVKITTSLVVKDDFFEDEILKMQSDILSGKFQREIMEENREKGIVQVKATIEIWKCESRRISAIGTS